MKVLAIFIVLVCLCINPAFSNSSIHDHLKKTNNGHEKLEISKKTPSKGKEENAIQISEKATISSIPGHNNVTEILVAKQPEFGLESSSDDVEAKEDVDRSNINIRESKKLNHYYKNQNQQVEAQEESEEEKKQQQQSPVKESAVQEQDENDNLQKQHQNEVQESVEEQQKEDNQQNQEQESVEEQQEENNQQNQKQKPVEEQQQEDNQQNQEQEPVEELHGKDNQQNQEEPVEERQENNQHTQEEPVEERQEEYNQQNQEQAVKQLEEDNQQNQEQKTVKQLENNQQNQEQELSEKQRKEDNHHHQHLQQQSQVQESKEEEPEKRDNQQLQLNMAYATKSNIQSNIQPMKAEQNTTMKENTNKIPSKSEGDTTENEVGENTASDNYKTLKSEKINSNLSESKGKQSENTTTVISSKNVKKVNDTVRRVTGKTQDKKHKNENLKQISDSQQKKEHEAKRKPTNKKHTQKQSFHPVARAKYIFNEQSKGTVKDSLSNEHFTNISNPEKTQDKSEGKKLVAVDNNLGNRVTKTDLSKALKPNIDEKLKNSKAPEKNNIMIPSASTAKPTKINKDQGPEFISDAIKASLDAAKKSVQSQKAQKEASSAQEPQTLKSKNEEKKEDKLVEKLRKELDKEEEKLLTKEKTEQKSLIQSHHSKKKYSTALIVVSLTLIISTILLSIAGVYYRKISIDGRRYYGHTLLNTEEDISLYTASNYNEDTNRYESWNSS